MDRERATTFGVAATLLALALIALLTIDQSRERSTPATRSSSPRPERPQAPRPPVRRAPRFPPTANVVARRFAGDWLDYLAGRRPVSSVRGADPSLLVAFAGGGRREALGPGTEGLRGVRCGPRRRGRRDCRAAVAGLPPLRFTLAVRGRPRVIALALD